MTQREAVLTLLTEAGPLGVTNAEFAQRRILRFGARVQELRDAGAEIACERVSGGTYRYVLNKRGESGRAKASPQANPDAPALSATLRTFDGEWKQIPVEPWMVGAR